jgi:Fur family ferric uptake transcriptional regulator
VACEELFIRSLRRRGFRLTPQREVILSALHQVVGLATVEEILTQVQMISTAVDVSTVYRTLDLLQKLGVVASVVGSDGQRRYELLHHHGPHIHLVCISCGEVTGASLEAFRPFMAHVREQHGFQVAIEQLSITGRCARCCATAEERDILPARSVSAADLSPVESQRAHPDTTQREGYTSPPNPLSAPETAGDFASGEGERSPSPRSGEGAGG